nr:hypothetical protein [Leuven Tombus-like virus 5]
MCESTLESLSEINSAGVTRVIESQDRNAQTIERVLNANASQAHSDSNSLWWELAGVIEELAAQTIAIDGAIVALGADLDFALSAMTVDLDGFITTSTALNTAAVAASATAITAELTAFKNLMDSRFNQNHVDLESIQFNTGITNSRLLTLVSKLDDTNSLLLRILECLGCA